MSFAKGCEKGHPKSKKRENIFFYRNTRKFIIITILQHNCVTKRKFLLTNNKKCIYEKNCITIFNAFSIC